MIETPVVEKHDVSSVQLLIAAGAALILALAGVRVYPFLVGSAVADAFLSVDRDTSRAFWTKTYGYALCSSLNYGDEGGTWRSNSSPSTAVGTT